MLSHTPPQPSDMPNDFYKEGYDGCYASSASGDTYSGNVAYGNRIPYQAIQGFVSDIYNASAGTGHRQSMLDPKASAMSFGQCEEYTTASIYFDYSKDINSAKFYSFPSAGYFPNTEMKVGEYWSVYFTGNVSGTISAKFTYKGKQYQANGVVSESGYPVMNFKMPEELQNLLGGANNNIPSGTKITFEVVGAKDSNLNNIIYRFDVTFFDMNSEMATSQNIADLIFDYKFYADRYPDLKQAFGYDAAKLKNHWLQIGIKEGRQASPLFDAKYYINNNSDVKQAFGEKNFSAAYNHFITVRLERTKTKFK